MSSRLIINADDFGLTPGVNRGIEELFHAGVLSSTTLMANAPAFEDAVTIAQRTPGLGVGCHIVLTDGKPLTESRHISTLLERDGKRFRSSLAAFACAALLGKLDEAEIEQEATAQIMRLLDANIHPTHLDSHKHTHMFPAVLRPLLRVAERFKIRSIRNPFEQNWSLHLGRGRALRRLQIHLLRLLKTSFYAQLQLREGRILTTRGALGVSATGDLEQTTLTGLLTQLPPGAWELVCHPGYYDEDLRKTSTRLLNERDLERQALLEVVPEMVVNREIQLISFGALRDGSDIAVR